MKILAFLFITSAASIHTSAFFGIWTAPGLEVLPTYAELQGPELDENSRPVEEPGIFPMNPKEDWIPWGVTEIASL